MPRFLQQRLLVQAACQDFERAGFLCSLQRSLDLPVIIISGVGEGVYEREGERECTRACARVRFLYIRI